MAIYECKNGSCVNEGVSSIEPSFRGGFPSVKGCFQHGGFSGVFRFLFRSCKYKKVLGLVFMIVDCIS